MKPLLSWILIGLALLTPLTSRAAPPLVLLSDSTGSYTLMLDALKQHFQGELDSAPLPFEHTITDRLILGLGSKACAQAMTSAETGSRVLCIFLPAQTFHELSASERGKNLLKQSRLSALFLDQPLERQMRLAKLIVPTIKTIGTVVGPDSEQQADEFSMTARALNLEPVIGQLNNDDNPVQVLTPVIERSDLFLPLPDRSVFNRAAAKWILYITLRNRVPLIGFSAKYADAGAVVALHSSVDQIAKESAQLIRTYQSNSALPSPAYPRHFSINVNNTAAKSLGLQLPTSERLIEQLERMEGR
ncbi:hypothetical protein GCM10011352_33040 [Marinobacterium zhoushanense]|uniref:ABC transporter substrate binding protein n=1 Tax=Marinobacterium zhoushanense TaxID=1679163 RepID=A0ABQ1KQ59_9GAMM|nr:ABC transporter substrate binding protein [Marinobacterium zhoushanense]GGC04213.1 hypothetical protein GCM10011352_33040 [Marinobacterium zhoushanense]